MMQTPEQVQFVQLFELHHGIVNKCLNVYCIRHTHEEDLRQEIAYEAWKAYSKFRGDCKFSTWLFVIARNTITTYFRKISNSLRKIEYDAELHDFPWQEYIEYHPPVLDCLSAKERATFMLYAEGKSYKEMEVLLGEPENRLRVRVSRIRQDLQRLVRRSLI